MAFTKFPSWEKSIRIRSMWFDGVETGGDGGLWYNLFLNEWTYLQCFVRLQHTRKIPFLYFLLYRYSTTIFLPFLKYIIAWSFCELSYIYRYAVTFKMAADRKQWFCFNCSRSVSFVVHHPARYSIIGLCVLPSVGRSVPLVLIEKCVRGGLGKIRVNTLSEWVRERGRTAHLSNIHQPTRDDNSIHSFTFLSTA